MLDNFASTAQVGSGLTTDLPDRPLLGSPALNTALDATTIQGRSSSGRNVLIFVADGLRPGSVNPIDAPTLYSIRQAGVNFANSHSLFPTFTTPNASAIATGHYLGDTGDFSNTIYSGFPTPSANGSPTPFIENDAVLADLNARYKGSFDAGDPDSFSLYSFLNEETLLQLARAVGYHTAAVGKLGPTLIQDVTQGDRGPDGKVPVPQTVVIDDATFSAVGVPVSDAIKTALANAGLQTTTPPATLRNQPAGNNTTPGTLNANVPQQQYFTDAVTKAILPTFKQEGGPFAMVYWSRDPDGTQHNQGDSLNSLTPGINGPTSKAGVKNADNNLAQIIQALKDQGLYDNTDIFITSDHGFSTISRSVVDTQGTPVNDYASTLRYSGVNPGFLPPGFVAIDLAHDLGLNLFDPDQATKAADGTYSYKKLDPTQGQRPNNGNGLLTASDILSTPNGTTTPPAKVIIAANGGSDLIYVPDHDLETVKQIVASLSKQSYTSGLFVDDALGSIAGTLPLSAINLKGDAQTPTPTIVLNFKTFSTDASNPYQSQVEIADTGLQQGQGMHGTFGRGDTFNNMAAIGPDFKRGYTDLAPVSNADVAVTLAHILGLPISDNGNLIGRVAQEALENGPNQVATTTGVLKSAADANGNRTYLNYQQVGDTRYFDTAGYAGRTVGLSTDLTADGQGGSKTFVIQRGDRAVITHFGGVGQGVDPSEGTIAEADTLKFVGQGLDARNLILTPQGKDLVITFEGIRDTQVTLKNFKLEDLDNLQTPTARANLSNLLFNGQREGTDSVDVFNHEEPRDQIFNPNTVTFLDSISHRVKGFSSDDVINAVTGGHTIYAGDGNDLVRGGTGKNTLYGEAGDDILEGGAGETKMVGGAGADTFVLSASDGLDRIQDFNPTQGDRIQLAGGLTYRQLSITQGTGSHRHDALIRNADSGKLLAIVRNTQADSLSDTLPFSGSIPFANPRSGHPDTVIAPGYRLQAIAQGSDPLENPSGVITNFGYLNDFPPQTVEPTKTEADQNTYLVFDQNPGGPTPGYDYGRHFLFQGHENSNNLSYVTRINLDVTDPAHRITLLTPVGPDSKTGINSTDGSTWDPLTKTLLFTQENGSKGGVIQITPGWPPVVTNLNGILGQGGYEGIHPDGQGNLLIIEDAGGTSVHVNPNDPQSPKAARQPNSFVYRFVPTDATDLTKGGQLQALQVAIDGQPITFHANDPVGDTFSQAQLKLHTPGTAWPVQWVTVHDTAIQGFAPFSANAAAKAAGATPFKRPENAQFLPGSDFKTFFFDPTGDTNADAGNQPDLAARGAWGSIFRVDLNNTGNQGRISLFVLGTAEQSSFDNLTFGNANTLLAAEDRGDGLHKQLNQLDSVWAYTVTGSNPNPRRFLALGRDPAAEQDAAYGEAGTPGFQNDGDNEPTGLFFSVGDASVQGMQGGSTDLTQARGFITQQHGNNTVYEIV